MSLDMGEGHKATAFYQFGLCSARNFLNMTRLPQTSTLKLFSCVFISLLIMVLFWQLSRDETNSVNNMQGALWFTMLSASSQAMVNVVLIFPEERAIFLREVNNNMYSCSAYFWAKVWSELPFSVAIPTIMGAIIFYAVDMNTIEFSRFLYFQLILILIYNASQGMGLLLSVSISKKELAVSMTSALIFLMMFFAGYFVPSDDIPDPYLPLEYMDIFKYGF